MSRHLNADPGLIAPFVIISGNPERTRWAAKQFLTAPQLVSDNRSAFVYTGMYKNLRVSFATSGMGMGSMRIYAHELFRDYGVQVIVRIGTAGGYGLNVKLFDLFNPQSVHSEILFNDQNINLPPTPHSQLFSALNATAQKMNLTLKTGKVHSTDFFYGPESFGLEAKKVGCEIIEMESYALWNVARQYSRQAATLLLVSDLISEQKNQKPKTSNFKERIYKTTTLFEIALKTLQNYV